MSGAHFPRIYRDQLRAEMRARISAAIQGRPNPD
jgi:hypothetical protein